MIWSCWLVLRDWEEEDGNVFIYQMNCPSRLSRVWCVTMLSAATCRNGQEQSWWVSEMNSGGGWWLHRASCHHTGHCSVCWAQSEGPPCSHRCSWHWWRHQCQWMSTPNLDIKCDNDVTCSTYIFIFSFASLHFMLILQLAYFLIPSKRRWCPTLALFTCEVCCAVVAVGSSKKDNKHQ